MKREELNTPSVVVGCPQRFVTPRWRTIYDDVTAFELASA